MTSVYYVVFQKKPQQLIGVAGTHECKEGSHSLCWFGASKKSYEPVDDQEAGLARIAEIFGGPKKIDVYEIGFGEYITYKVQLRRG